MTKRKKRMRRYNFRAPASVHKMIEAIYKRKDIGSKSEAIIKLIETGFPHIVKQ